MMVYSALFIYFARGAQNRNAYDIKMLYGSIPDEILRNIVPIGGLRRLPPGRLQRQQSDHLRRRILLQRLETHGHLRARI